MKKKTRTMWKSLLLIFTMLMMLGLAGCSAGEKSNEGIGENPSQTISESTSEAIIESTEETISETTIAATNETTTPASNEVSESSTESLNENPTENTTENITENITENTDSTFSIHFIDVGQADAALIECDGSYMLIDGGNRADSDKMYAILKEKEIKHLEIVVGTHGHEDHIGGLPGALNYATAGLTLSPVKAFDSKAFSNFKKYADLNGGGITIPSVGDSYSLGSASVKILGVNGGTDTNDTSIVLKVTYGNTTFLFTGDAEREAEQAILASGEDISATVLKVGHHGSDSSTTYPFLREIMPKYAVISVGEGNTYGHPTDDTLSRLRDADVQVFRTDLQGDIYCVSDGETVTFTTEQPVSTKEIMSAAVLPKSELVVVETEPQTVAAVEAPVQTEPVVKETIAEPQTVAVPILQYILNTNTKKFHEPDCKSVKQMKDKNKKEFSGTRDEVIDMGYDPCGNCHP